MGAANTGGVFTSVGPSDHVPDHVTLQGTYPHRGKRKIIFKIALVGDMLVPRRVFILLVHVKKMSDWMIIQTSEVIKGQ